MSKVERYIPFFPLGRPNGEADEVMTAVCQEAVGLDACRKTVELPPISRPLGEAPDTLVLLQRFIGYARRSYQNPTDTPLLCLPYREGFDVFRKIVETLNRELSFVKIHGVHGGQSPDEPLETRHVLFLESQKEVQLFHSDISRLGFLSGELHQGASLRSPAFGLWVIITWCPVIPRRHLGRQLKEVLAEGIPAELEDTRYSTPAPPPPEEVMVRKAPPRRLSGSMGAIGPTEQRVLAHLSLQKKEPKE